MLSAITEREAGFIEGYAMALEDVQGDLTGERFSAKSYDPATVDLSQAVIYSYAFDLKDGGRRHPLADYSSVDEICALMATETLEYIRAELSIRHALAAATGTAKTPQAVECEASQSGPKGNAQPNPQPIKKEKGK